MQNKNLSNRQLSKVKMLWNRKTSQICSRYETFSCHRAFSPSPNFKNTFLTHLLSSSSKHRENPMHRKNPTNGRDVISNLLQTSVGWNKDSSAISPERYCTSDRKPQTHDKNRSQWRINFNFLLLLSPLFTLFLFICLWDIFVLYSFLENNKSEHILPRKCNDYTSYWDAIFRTFLCILQIIFERFYSQIFFKTLFHCPWWLLAFR